MKYGAVRKLCLKHLLSAIHVLNRQNGQYQRGRDTE